MGLCIQVTLSRYHPQVLPGGTLVPGAGGIPAGCFPACGLQTTYTVSLVQMPYALGRCVLSLQPQTQYQDPILLALRTLPLTHFPSELWCHLWETVVNYACPGPVSCDDKPTGEAS